MVLTEVAQKINLMDGTFTPSEASLIIEALINEKINFHKIQRLQSWIGNENCDSNDLNCRITELTEELKKSKSFFDEARKEKMNLVIKGTLNISFEDELERL